MSDQGVLLAAAIKERDLTSYQLVCSEFSPVRPPDTDASILSHRPLLLALARKLTRNPTDADDLVQDTLERGLLHAHRLRPGSNTRAWLTRILHNRFIDQCRSAKRRRTVALDNEQAADRVDHVTAAIPLPEPLWARTDTEDLQDALRELKPSFRRVFEMHALQQLSYADIAKRLDIPKATVGTRLHRARANLRQLLVRNAAKGAHHD